MNNELNNSINLEYKNANYWNRLKFPSQMLRSTSAPHLQSEEVSDSENICVIDDKFYNFERRNSCSSIRSYHSGHFSEEPGSISLKAPSIDDNSQLIKLSETLRPKRTKSEPFNQALYSHTLLMDEAKFKSLIAPQTEVFQSSVESVSTKASSHSTKSRKNSRKGWDGELFKITILKLNHNEDLTNPFVKITLGDRTYQTQPSENADGGWNETFTFYVTYHDQLFNTLQLDVFNYHWLLPAQHKGRAEFRLIDLNSFPSKFTTYYELYRREVALGALSQWAKVNRHYPNVGAIQVKIEYAFINLDNNDTVEIIDPSTAISSDAHFTKLERADHLIEASELWETLSQPTIHPKVDDTSSALHTVGSYLVSQPTLTLLKGVAKVYYAFQQGLELSVLEFLTGVTILEKYFRLHASKQVEGELITEYNEVEVMADYYSYAMAAYGWRGILVIGKLPPLINGKPPSDQSAVMNYLHLTEDRLLGYEFLDNQVFRPNYFICLDSKGDLVLSIRGTLSAMDTLTDLVCEYKPWKGGLVHGGILAAATWFMTSVVPALMCHAVNHQVKTIYIVGHSLGGGTASVLSMLLNDHLKVAHLPLEHTIRLKCFAYGPPPCVTQSVAEQFTDLITTVVNGDDIASTLCYGGLMDFKSLVLAAVETSKEVGLGWGLGMPFKDPTLKDPKWQQLCAQLDASRAHMRLTPDHYPKLYLAGTIYRIRSTLEPPKGYHWNRSAFLTQDQVNALTKAGKKLNAASNPTKFAFMELLESSNFIEIRVSLTMLLNHVINMYDDAFRLVRETLLGGSFGGEGDNPVILDEDSDGEAIPMTRLVSSASEQAPLTSDEVQQTLLGESGTML